jgi:hypothetical protein
MKNRIFVLLALCAGLMGCSAGYGDKLDTGLVQSLKLQQVTVSVAPNATFWWSDGEVAYAHSIGRPFTDTSVAASPEGQAFMRNLASQRVKVAFDRELAGRLNGTHLARVEVTINDINIASAMQRIVIGGGYSIKGSVRLVDAKTGAVLAENPSVTSSAVAGQGILGTAIDAAVADEPINRVSAQFAQSYRGWLLPAEAGAEAPPRS